jgi:hypothetical protein
MLKGALLLDSVEQEAEKPSREKEVEAKETAKENLAQREFCTTMQTFSGSRLLNFLQIMPSEYK